MTIGATPADSQQPLWAWDWLRRSTSRVRLDLTDLARRHGWDVNAIAAVVQIESSGDPSAVNPSTGATGLIQFTAATAQRLGTSTWSLGRMSSEEQLPYVERYLAAALRSPPADASDYYMGTFLPAQIGAPDDRELSRKGQKVYDQNSGLDENKDGVLTVGDVRQVFRKLYAGMQGRVGAGSVGWLDLTAAPSGSPPRSPFGRGRPRSPWGWAAVAAMLTGGVLVWRKRGRA